MRIFPLLPALVVGSALFTLHPALAQTDPNKAQARALGEKAFDALRQGDWATAADLYQRADELYHAPTLTLGLARAQTHLGKFVEAWENYQRIIVDGPPPGANAVMKNAVEEAKTEIDSVEGRRARVVLTVDGAPHPKVTLDGLDLPEAGLGVERFVDPGAHTVHAVAGGYQPADATFTVAEGATTSTRVTLLPQASATPIATEPPLTDAPKHGNSRRTLGIVGMGVGGASIVVGAITGALAIGKHSSLKDDPCITGCAQPALGSYQSGVSAYNGLGAVSTITFIVGGVLAAGGAVLFFTAPRRAMLTGAWITPYVGMGNAGVTGIF